MGFLNKKHKHKWVTMQHFEIVETPATKISPNGGQMIITVQTCKECPATQYIKVPSSTKLKEMERGMED